MEKIDDVSNWRKWFPILIFLVDIFISSPLFAVDSERNHIQLFIFTEINTVMTYFSWQHAIPFALQFFFVISIGTTEACSISKLTKKMFIFFWLKGDWLLSRYSFSVFIFRRTNEFNSPLFFLFFRLELIVVSITRITFFTFFFKNNLSSFSI